MDSLLKRYRVDSVPLILRPFFYLYGFTIGLFFYLSFVILHYTCSITYEGAEDSQNEKGHILCVWHEQVALYFITFIHHKVPHMWMNDPSWYMKPIHVSMRLSGVRGLIYGSTGNKGREAADRLVNYLKEGYSTMLTPDGPGGPLRSMKKGAVHMAIQSGASIVPIQFHTSKSWRWPSWDKKIIPFPFSKIRVVFGKPVKVTEENFDQAYHEIVKMLG